MAEDLLDQVEFSETGEQVKDELSREDLEPRPEVLEMAALADQSVQAAAVDQIKTPQDVLYDDLARLKDKIGAEIPPEDIDQYLKDWQNKYTEYRTSSKRESLPVEILTLLLPYLAPFITAFSQASIPAEKNIAQGLRRKFRPTLLDLSNAMQYLRRNPEYKDRFNHTLASAGYEDTDIQALTELIEVLPSAQDVISFMVREVYNQEAVSKFQLSEGFTELYAQAKNDADKAGVSEDTLKKYWQSHWHLPGVNQVYEMIHREVITEDTGRLILRAADIMPGFIDPLLEIAFNPLTRVDVRRIAKYLNKDNAWIKKQYKVLGFNDENAQIMADFTEAYNNDPEADGQTEIYKRKIYEQNLTKSDILKLYSLKLVNRPDSRIALKDIGYSADEADLYLDRADFEEGLEIIELHEASLKSNI